MEFHSLNVGFERSFVDLAEGNDWEGVTCAVEPDHQRAGRRVSRLHLEIVRKVAVDFSRTILGYYVITERVVEALNAAGLTGFELMPTEITSDLGLRGQVSPVLWEICATGKGGYAHSQSGIVLKDSCDACGLERFSAYERGIVVDESAYDGSDIFAIREYPTHILVNDRARSLLEDCRFTNLAFVESSKLEWPVGVVKP